MISVITQCVKAQHIQQFFVEGKIFETVEWNDFKMDFCNCLKWKSWKWILRANANNTHTHTHTHTHSVNPQWRPGRMLVWCLWCPHRWESCWWSVMLENLKSLKQKTENVSSHQHRVQTGKKKEINQTEAKWTQTSDVKKTFYYFMSVWSFRLGSIQFTLFVFTAEF